MPGNIFIIGFMGAGKTTFGKKLASKLGKQFVDLDEAIARANNVADVKTIIDQKGIDEFRNIESQTLKSLPLGDCVVSTGGGAPCYFDNLQWMKSNGKVVYLELDEKTLFNRLKQTDLNERPLLRGMNDEQLQGFIHEKLEERLPYYQSADVVFNPLRNKIEELYAFLNFSGDNS